MNTSSRLGVRLAVLLCGLICLGCNPPQDPFLELADAKSKVMQVDDLNRAMELVFSEQSYNQKEFEDKVSVGLNRWIKKLLGLDAAAAEENGQWRLDPAVLPLIEAHRNLEVVTRINKPVFVGSDAFFLRMCAWENRLAKRICEASPLSALELFRLAARQEELDSTQPRAATVKIVHQLHPELAAADAERLNDAIQLFDWIVRNIHLEPTRNPTPDQVAAERLNTIETEMPAVQGVRGPGYLRYRWQLLYFGRGDYIERARLMLGLCGQRGLDAALLATGKTPWAVGVRIADHVFLFDTRLGLPIPGTASGRVATLQEIKANPQLLTKLDLTLDESTRDNTKYWMTAEQLPDLRALLMVTPESISRRMQFIQDRLIGDFQIPVADPASVALQKWQGLDGVQPELWDIEFQVHQFRAALRNALAQASYDDETMSKVLWYFQDEAYVDGFAQYRTARDLFVLGRFESERTSNKLNAIESFYNLIYSDKAIETLSLNRNLLSRLGILQEKGQSAAEFQNRLRDVQGQMRLVRRDAGVFLAQSHFDNGNPNAAARWLERMRDREDTERWIPSIEYLLGRSGEARREYSEALKFYQSADSEQFHGDRIRARLLAEMIQASDP